MYTDEDDIRLIKQKQLQLFEAKRQPEDSPALPVLKSNVFFYRHAAQLTQDQLAKRVGVSRNTIYGIESERVIPSTLLALQLAKALRVQIGQLFEMRYYLPQDKAYRARHPMRVRLRHIPKSFYETWS